MSAADVVRHRLAVARHGLAVEFALVQQLGHDGRETSGFVILFTQHLTGRLHVEEQGDVEPDPVPVVKVEGDTDVFGDGVEVDRRVRASSNRRVDDDGVLKGLSCHDVAGLAVRVDHFHNLSPGFVGALCSLAVRSRDGSRTRQSHA